MTTGSAKISACKGGFVSQILLDRSCEEEVARPLLAQVIQTY